MRNIYRFTPRRSIHSIATAVVVAATIGGVYAITHSPVAGESTPAAAPTGSQPTTETPFVYFPSQYELHAPAGPEDHIQAF